MADTKRSMQCGHCGKLVVFEVRGEYTHDDAVLVESPYLDWQEITTWRTLECKWCKKPTLEETKTSYSWVDGPVYSGMEPVSTVITILYPGAKTAKAPLTNLPEMIEKKYMAALKVQDIEPSACAVLVGRTLEAILEYLYVAPAKIAAVQARLKKTS